MDPDALSVVAGIFTALATAVASFVVRSGLRDLRKQAKIVQASHFPTHVRVEVRYSDGKVEYKERDPRDPSVAQDAIRDLLEA